MSDFSRECFTSRNDKVGGFTSVQNKRISYYGAHVNTADITLIEAAKKIKKIGGNILQIFLTLPNKRTITKRSTKELDEFNNYLKKNNMKVIVHSSYIHNMSRDWDKYSSWIINFIMEIKYAHQIGATGIVIHTGKQLNLSEWDAWNNMYTSLVYIHNKTKEYDKVKILLETPSGQGTEILYKIEDFARFYKKFSITKNIKLKNRFKICLDTCHIFAAGYDLTSIMKIKLYLEVFDELIGINNIYVVHFNDSLKGVGSKRDRHANIGKGEIGLKNLKYIFKYFKSLYIPIILETPENNSKLELEILFS